MLYVKRVLGLRQQLLAVVSCRHAGYDDLRRQVEKPNKIEVRKHDFIKERRFGYLQIGADCHRKSDEQIATQKQR